MGSALTYLGSNKPVVDMESGTAKFVRDTINDNKVVIFSKTYCPYCNLAKDQFRKLNVIPYVIELDNRNDGEEIQDVLGQITGARTVPRCFINCKFIGGGTDVKKMYEQGTLQKYFS